MQGQKEREAISAMDFYYDVGMKVLARGECLLPLDGRDILDKCVEELEAAMRLWALAFEVGEGCHLGALMQGDCMVFTGLVDSSCDEEEEEEEELGSEPLSESGDDD